MFVVVSPYIPMSDYERIFSLNINTVSSSQVMRGRKNMNLVFFFDPIPSSPNNIVRIVRQTARRNYMRPWE